MLKMFEFKPLNYFTDGEIDLILDRIADADDEKGYVPAYRYNIKRHSKLWTIGYIDIRIGSSQGTYYGGNIGYRIKKRHRGHGFAAKACRLIKKVALEHGIDELIITCNPDNTASRKTCENIGAVLKEIVDLPQDNEMYKMGEHQKCRYVWTVNV